MSDPAWQELQLETRRQSLEPLEDWLFEAGAVAVTLEDAADQPLLEPGPGETPVWDSIRLVALFPVEMALEPVLEALPEEWLAEGPKGISPLEERDWERAWMDAFQPMQMGKRLWVCPSWIDPPEPDAVNLILDPGLAFGSGTHPTTALCLGALDEIVTPGQCVVDYGCGSGILGIATLLLGAERVLGVDNDPQALTASGDNATRNGVDEALFEVVMPDAPSVAAWSGQADVVVANILANPLIDLSATLRALLKPGGKLLLAGLLRDQADSVIEAYAPGIELQIAAEQEGWALLLGTSPEPAVP